MVTLTKRALIRDPRVPVGQPAPMHVNCGCGRPVPIVADDINRCACGVAYDGLGWISL